MRNSFTKLSFHLFFVIRLIIYYFNIPFLIVYLKYVHIFRIMYIKKSNCIIYQVFIKHVEMYVFKFTIPTP